MLPRARDNRSRLEWRSPFRVRAVGRSVSAACRAKREQDDPPPSLEALSGREGLPSKGLSVWKSQGLTLGIGGRPTLTDTTSAAEASPEAGVEDRCRDNRA